MKKLIGVIAGLLFTMTAQAAIDTRAGVYLDDSKSQYLLGFLLKRIKGSMVYVLQA